MFDTHCHLNFKIFKNNYSEVISRAREAGVTNIIIPGTDIESSKKAIEIAEKFDGVYAAVGIHPHHTQEFRIQNLKFRIKEKLKQIETLLVHPKVVAIGEVGLDSHIYKNTKYKDYQITDEFIKVQKELFVEQIKLAVKYKKRLIIHNWEADLHQGFGRQAKNNLLNILNSYFLPATIPAVFHCCEPDRELLDFAKKHQIFIGVDGDVTYNQDKQNYVKQIPLELLVLETDSPYLLPQPLRDQKLFPNEPKNIPIIAEYIARLKNISTKKIIEATTDNAKKLFGLNK